MGEGGVGISPVEAKRVASGPWRCLEEIRGLAGVAAEWEKSCGADFQKFSANFLTKTTQDAAVFACVNGCGCEHELFPQAGGGFNAVCQCGEDAGCDDFRVSAEDAKIWELLLPALRCAIAAGLGIVSRDEPSGTGGVMQVGVVRGGTVPVLLCIADNREDFRCAVAELAGRLQGAFVLIAPTGRFVDVGSQTLLKAAGAEFLDMDTHIAMKDSGGLSASEVALEMLSRMDGAASRAVKPGECDAKIERRVTIGRLSYFPNFNEVWLDDDKRFDLRERAQARACLQFLVDAKAFDRDTARHLVNEIDPYVRKQCNITPLRDYSEFRIHHYFNPTKGVYAELCRALIKPAGRNRCYYLKVF